jgi:predicted XRE-type DNA-binding protein
MARQRTPVGGNIFEDLGFDAEEAENLKIRSRLMGEVRRVMKERKLKQGDAATLFGTTQPRISEIVGGKIDEFTIDALVNMLAHAGIHMEVHVLHEAS